MPWISAAGSIAGGLLGGAGANKASKAQAKATKAAIAEERRQYDTNRADLAPWRDQGGLAINRLGVLMGLDPRGGATFNESAPDRAAFTTAGTPAQAAFDAGDGGWSTPATPGTPGSFDQAGYDSALSGYNTRRSAFDSAPAAAGFGDLTKKFTLADFWDDPVTKASYQQGLDQGTKALANMAGARGNRNSGAQLKALERFTTDYTGNQAAGSQARFVGDQTNLYNRLAGISGTGQTAASQGAIIGQGNTNTIAELVSGQGNARGAAAIARGNAASGAIRNVGNIFGNNSGGGGNAQNYNAAGVFQPYYSGYDSGGGPAYG